MKKHLMFLVCSILLLSFAKAQAPDLVVSSNSYFNASGTYKPKGTYNGKTYWVGPETINQYCISFEKFSKNWAFSQWYGDTNSLFNTLEFYSSTLEIPTGVWNNRLEVSVAGPGLKYTSELFREIEKNDGSFLDTILVQHNKFNGQKFAGNDGDDFVAKGYAKIANLPAGLEAAVIRKTDSTLELTLLKNALTHDVDTNFILTFTDAAYANGGKADSTSKNSQKISINFINIYRVAKSGGDFDSIQQAINSARDFDIIEIGEGVFTEVITANTLRNITIKGMGPDKTIIQADTAPKIASNRVFTFANYECKAVIEGVTIRNGYSFAPNGNAGAISVRQLEIRNCRVTDNHAFSLGSGQTYAGGILCQGGLEMYNTEVTNNSCDNVDQKGQFLGGAIFSGGYLYIENSTISGNYSRGDGAGLLHGNATSGKAVKNQIVNSTITNNVSGNNGGGVNTYDSLKLINSIVYGNTGVKGADIYQINGHVYPVTLVNSFVGNIISNVGDTAKLIGKSLEGNPMLDTLAFNCASTRTHALLEGSPALDAGTSSYNVPVLDQRGFEMINAKDIGSYESVGALVFEIGRDSICLGSLATLELKGSHKSGIFEGTGVSGNVFSAAELKEEGFVTITYSLDYEGCQNFAATDSILVYACVNDVNQPKAFEVNIYPNPASDKLYISTEKAMATDVVIYDLSGKVLIAVTVVDQREGISIASLPVGMYMVSTTSDGMKRVQKMVKL